jgi:NADPH:quinone reductase-like Zn-dependent oxidoreductase
MVQNAAILHPYSLFNHIGDATQKTRGIQWVLDAVNGGSLSPIVARVFPFDDALDAYDYMELGHHLGKIVIRVA